MRIFLAKHGALVALLSVLVVIPCVWHRHIASGDLGSHVYNAWLAELVEQGRAPGVYVVAQWKNVLFDLMLFYIAKITGLFVAEKIAVALCVLTFFWGVFAFVTAATRRLPWFLTPLIAMLAYGYVFYLGFMNYYLSIGLACFGLALMWTGEKRRFLVALVMSPLIVLAHPLGLLWFLGTASYRLLWVKLEGWTRLFLPALVAAVSIATCLFFARNPQLEADWEQSHLILRNGFDQLMIYGFRFDVLARLVMVFLLVCVVFDFWKRGRNTAYWKARRLILELYCAAYVVTAFAPQDFRPDPNAGWVGLLVTRLTLITAIFALCWIGSLQPRAWQLAGFASAAAFFFVFLYQDTGRLDRLETNADRIVRELPFGTRIVATVFEDPEQRPMFVHAVDRSCAGRCFIYSNYEPSTLEFRVRANPGSPVVTASPDDSEDMQFGNYQVQPGDLPLKQIYQCDASDLTRLCIRDLTAGEQNGRLGYRPAP